MIRAIICIFLLVMTMTSFGQVGINENGSLPDPSAMLDVKSSSKGMLIPRMTTVERQTIVNPAQGLMVYDQNTNAFYYFNGIGWLELLSGTVTELKDANGDTKIQVEESIDDDIIRFDVEGVERVKMVENRIEVVNNDDNIFIGEGAGNPSVSNVNNIGIGTRALDSITSGYHNIALGKETLRSNTTGINNFGAGSRVMLNNKTGQSNVAIGYENLFKNTSGRDNIALGYYVLHENTSGRHNVGLGNFAIQSNTTGDYNMGIGNFAIQSNTTGDNNVALGNLALEANSIGSNNSAIGHLALLNNETGNQNTAIGYEADVLSPNLRKATAIGALAKVDCDNCMVLGEVDSIRVGIGTSTPEEKLHVVGSMKLVDGNQQDGHVLTSDADGKASWQTLGSIVDDQELTLDGTNLSIEDGNTVDITQTNISDDDGDTKIQVEETADEDVIRMDIAGQEEFTFKYNDQGKSKIQLSSNSIFIGNENTGKISSGDENIGIGMNALSRDSLGSKNIAIGSNSLGFQSSGEYNVAIGNTAQGNANGGSYNISFGRRSLNANEGERNIAIGAFAGIDKTTGDDNVFIGIESGAGLVEAGRSQNTMVGSKSGIQNSGNGNVFLGYEAGAQEEGSDKLYIENSNTLAPLIYGEFDNDLVRINGDLEVTGNFPGKSLVQDMDGDSKIYLNDSVDDDIIRMDVDTLETVLIGRSGSGRSYIQLPNNSNSISIGSSTGLGNTDDNARNVFIGNKAGETSSTGSANIAIGYASGTSIGPGNANVIIGNLAATGLNNPNSSVIIGRQAGYLASSSASSVMIGNFAGNNSAGSGNLFLGSFAGKGETNSNRLHINHAIQTVPLIYGEFDNRFVKIDGRLSIANKYIFPNATGSSGMILKHNGTNNLEWSEDNDNQGFETFLLSGTTLTAVLENNNNPVSIDLASVNTDNQTVDSLNLNGDILEISLEDDEQAKKTVDLSTVDNQTIDVLNLDGNTLELSLEDDGQPTQTVDLSVIDTDNQTIDVLNLNGSTLELSLEDDGEMVQSVDLSSIDTDEQTLSYNDDTQSVSIANGNTLDLSQLAVPVGSIMMWYTSTPPDGWLICDGTNIPSQYTDLIGLIGNSLPDLLGRFALGAGERNEGSLHNLNDTGGFEEVILQENNIPEHNHNVTITYREGEEQGSGNNYSDLGGTGSQKTYTTDDWGGDVNGMTRAHENMPPFLTIHYIIKAK